MRPDGFAENSTKVWKEELTNANFAQFFQKIKVRTSTHFVKQILSWKQKQIKKSTKIDYRPIFINIDTYIRERMLTNRVQWYIK